MLWAGPLPGLEGWCVAGTGLPVAPCPADLVELLPRGGPPVGPPLYNVRGAVTPPPQAWPDTGRLPLPLPLFLAVFSSFLFFCFFL